MGVIAKYKFNNTLADLLPEFNSEFTSDLYTITDEVNGDVTTRTIESDSLPTLMRFGSNLDTYVEGKEIALLEVLDMNTSGLTSCYRMFRYCKNLTSISCEWNTSNVANMYTMFANCNNLTTVDVSNFDTNKVTNMRGMFYGCNNLTTLDVSNFNTSKVNNMSEMFYNCTNLTSLDVSNWDISKVTTMQEMLEHCNNLKYLKCNNITTLNTLNTYLPTKSSTSQGTIICKSDITNLDTTSLQSKYWNILDEPILIAKYVFDKSIYNNCIPVFNTEFEGYFIEDEVVEGNNEVTRTIESCGMLPTIMRFGSKWSNTDNSTNREKSLLLVFDMNMQELTTGYCMFYRCGNLTNVTSSITSAKMETTANMFQHCTKIKSIDIILDTSNVTNMNNMFCGCYYLVALDVSNWDTSKVADMSNMFYGCKSLTALDVSNFDTSKVTNTTNMFRNTPLLTDIGVLYMDKSSLQKLVNAMPTDLNKTLWYKDVDIDGITHGNNITLKKYIEENVEIVLNNPLLEGDTIEIVDGKLCHYHKMGMVVLDGSEDEGWDVALNINVNGINYLGNGKILEKGIENRVGYCDKLATIIGTQESFTTINQICFHRNTVYSFAFYISTALSTRIEILQWLQANPITVVYELATPYYEDITPLQSSLALRTFEECNIQIITALPIKTKITYRTNITSAVVMEQELDALDSGVNLSNLIEEEVNE